jgi:hypothetical protein
MRTLLTLLLSLAACAGPTVATRPRGAAPEVRIVDGAVARRYAKRSTPVVLPFGTGQNGNELVLGLLALAQRSGADFVSDIALTLVFKWNGIPIACATRVVFPGDPRLAPAAPASAPAAPAPPASMPDEADGEPTFESEVRDYQPKRVDFEATERELFCTKRPHQVKVAHPSFDSEFDVERRSLSEPMVTVEETNVVWTEECEARPVQHRVTRFDYEAKVAFVPVHWEYIARRFAEAGLVETPPLCYRLADGDLPAHTIRAQVSFRGHVDGPAPFASWKGRPARNYNLISN